MSQFEDEKREVVMKTAKFMMMLICVLAVVLVIAAVCLIGSGVWWLALTLTGA